MCDSDGVDTASEKEAAELRRGPGVLARGRQRVTVRTDQQLSQGNRLTQPVYGRLKRSSGKEKANYLGSPERQRGLRALAHT